MVNCRSKEGQEIIDMLLSYVSIQLLTDDKFEYEMSEIEDGVDKRIYVQWNCSDQNNFYFYNMRVLVCELDNCLKHCEMNLIFDAKKITRQKIKDELSKINISDYYFRNYYTIHQLIVNISDVKQIHKLIEMYKKIDKSIYEK